MEWVKIQRFMAEVRPAVICVEPLGFYIVSKTCNKKKYAKKTPDEREKKEKEDAEINANDKRNLFVSTTYSLIH